MLKGGETRLRELDTLLSLVEAYLRDLPYLGGRESVLREYETARRSAPRMNPSGRTPSSRSASATSEEELDEKLLDAEAARAARLREVYAMIGLQVAVRPSGALDISLGANAVSSSGSKGVVSWDESC